MPVDDVNEDEMRKELINDADVQKYFLALKANRDQIFAFIKEHENDIQRIAAEGPSLSSDQKIIAVLFDFALGECDLNADIRLE